MYERIRYYILVLSAYLVRTFYDLEQESRRQQKKKRKTRKEKKEEVKKKAGWKKTQREDTRVSDMGVAKINKKCVGKSKQNRGTVMTVATTHVASLFLFAFPCFRFIFATHMLETPNSASLLCVFRTSFLVLCCFFPFSFFPLFYFFCRLDSCPNYNNS